MEGPPAGDAPARLWLGEEGRDGGGVVGGGSVRGEAGGGPDMTGEGGLRGQGCMGSR